MLRNKYADTKLTKRMLASKQRAKVLRLNTDVNSRDIIISIFNQETES